VSQIVINHLTRKGLAARGRAAATVSGQDQRDTSIFASTVDLKEAHDVGAHAIEVALKAGTGWMATILRKPDPNYQAYYDKVPLDKVANSERTLPQRWLSKNKLDVTDDFVRYARPLIGEEWPPLVLEHGIQRFARFKMVFADKKCPPYVPKGHR
jgi:6-phosphofructokinase 1